MYTCLLTCFLACFLFTGCSQWELDTKTSRLYKAPDMVLVEGGSFMMGSTERTDEVPVHKVTVKGFLIGRYEVTVKQYQDFCTDTGRNFPFPPTEGWQTDSPIVNITWDDATAYCTWLSQQTGKNFRLPTEAEWEFAAQGGNASQSFRYAGSNTPEDVAWFGGNENLIAPGIRSIGKKKSNELLLYDMSGNVWEWCSDWYGGYPVTSVTNPTGPATGTKRVAKGGSWFDYVILIRTKARWPFDQFQALYSIGFRLVEDI